MGLAVIVISLTVSTVFLIAPLKSIPLDKEFILLSKTSLAVMFFLTSNVVGPASARGEVSPRSDEANSVSESELTLGNVSFGSWIEKTHYTDPEVVLNARETVETVNESRVRLRLHPAEAVCELEG